MTKNNMSYTITIKVEDENGVVIIKSESLLFESAEQELERMRRHIDKLEKQEYENTI